MSRWLKRCGDYFRRRPLRILTASNLGLTQDWYFMKSQDVWIFGVYIGLRGVVTLRTNKESLEHCISDSIG
ncbi:hypothetical protein IGI04_035971 [Brassica rapa subsp. trilocularis]|uniref:Uncharacterized protein n=1 Tax=Brassica rapa subsp. trilocularis TaxID=1813537 RepID=A0ABQ7LGY2_BRACM|nr:hypothetical protein IGI04_035971 [Brassica rapa subsp. trilocularis]